jgi:hypothetical protein
MKLRFKWMLLLAFVLGQLAVSNLSSAVAAKTAVTESVYGTASMAHCTKSTHCCDFGSFDNCSLCVACASYAPPQTVVAPISLQQSYYIADPLAQFSRFNSLDPPPPRSQA